MRKLVYFFIFIILNTVFFSYILYTWYGILIGPFFLFYFFFIKFIKFFITIFIPVYIVLSLYSIRIKGYYHLKFLGYGIKPSNITRIINKILFYLTFNIMQYRLYCLFLLVSVYIYNCYLNRISFLIILVLSIIYILLINIYYKTSYKSYKTKNSLKFWLYFEKFAIYLNINFFIILYIWLKNENNIIDYQVINNLFEENDLNLLWDLSFSKWTFKYLFNETFKEDFKEDLYSLEDLPEDEDANIDRYFSDYNKYKNLYFEYVQNPQFDFDFDLNSKLPLIKNNYILDFIKPFINIDNFIILQDISVFNKTNIQNALLFKLNDNVEENCIYLNDTSKFNNLYHLNNFDEIGNAYYEILDVSKDIILPLNTVDFFSENLNLFLLDDAYDKEELMNRLKEEIEQGLYDEEEIASININSGLEDILNKSINEQLFYYNEVDEDPFFLIKKITNKSLNDLLIINNDVKVINNSETIINNSYFIEIKAFITWLLNNQVINEIYLLMNNSKFNLYKILFFQDKMKYDYIFDDNLLESFIQFYKKNIVYFNMDFTSINEYNILFISLLDLKNDWILYWDDYDSVQETIDRDEFGLHLNVTNYTTYAYSKHLFNLNSLEYLKSDYSVDLDNEIDETLYLGDTYEIEPSEGNLYEYADVEQLYERLINYDDDLERLYASFLWDGFNNYDFKLQYLTHLHNFYEYGINSRDSIIENFWNINIKQYSSYLNLDYEKATLNEVLDKLNKLIIVKRREFKEGYESDFNFEYIKLLKQNFIFEYVFRNILLTNNNIFHKNNTNMNVENDCIVFINDDKTGLTLFNNYIKSKSNIFNFINNINKDIKNNTYKNRIINSIPAIYKDWVNLGFYLNFIDSFPPLRIFDDKFVVCLHNYIKCKKGGSFLYVKEKEIIDILIDLNLRNVYQYIKIVNNNQLHIINQMEKIFNDYYNYSDRTQECVYDILKIIVKEFLVGKKDITIFVKKVDKLIELNNRLFLTILDKADLDKFLSRIRLLPSFHKQGDEKLPFVFFLDYSDAFRVDVKFRNKVIHEYFDKYSIVINEILEIYNKMNKNVDKFEDKYYDRRKIFEHTPYYNDIVKNISNVQKKFSNDPDILVKFNDGIKDLKKLDNLITSNHDMIDEHYDNLWLLLECMNASNENLKTDLMKDLSRLNKVINA
jgi:predicted transcriptional regulator